MWVKGTLHFLRHFSDLFLSVKATVYVTRVLTGNMIVWIEDYSYLPFDTSWKAEFTQLGSSQMFTETEHVIDANAFLFTTARGQQKLNAYIRWSKVCGCFLLHSALEPLVQIQSKLADADLGRISYPPRSFALPFM